jgi:hypothetical protein
MCSLVGIDRTAEDVVAIDVPVGLAAVPVLADTVQAHVADLHAHRSRDTRVAAPQDAKE